MPKLDLAVTADLVEDRFFQPLLDGGMQQARLLVVGRGVARAKEGRCLVHVAERGDPGPELLVEDFIVERERQAGRNDQIARVANRLGMQQARIDIGGEQHAVGKGGAQRLHQQQLVVHVGADHADRPDLRLGTTAVRFQLDLLHQATHIVPLVAAFRPLDRRLLVVLRLVAARHKPHLAGGAVDIGPVQTAQIGIVLQLEPIALAAMKLALQRLRESSGVDRIPLAQQDDAPARIVGEAARAQFPHQKPDLPVVRADGAEEEGRRTGRPTDRPKQVLEGLGHAVLPGHALRAFRQGRQARRRVAQLAGRRGRKGTYQSQPGQGLRILLESRGRQTPA